MPKYRRRIKLIRPGLQLRLTGVFVGLLALGLLLQAFVFVRELMSIAALLPSDGALVVNEVQRTVLAVLGISLAVLLPITAWIGVLVTHRIAGPVHRIEGFLRAVARGERPGDCSLRKGDELNELCRVVNEATAPLRVANAATGAAGAAGATGANGANGQQGEQGANGTRAQHAQQASAESARAPGGRSEPTRGSERSAA